MQQTVNGKGLVATATNKPNNKYMEIKRSGSPTPSNVIVVIGAGSTGQAMRGG